MSDIAENSAASLMARLREPFPSTNLSWRAGACNSEKTRGQALPYIDARDVQNRLDEVVGPENWCNELEQLPSGAGLICKIGLFIGGRWIYKSDVAQQDSTAGTKDNRQAQAFEIAVKGAASDAFKRAAVMWGIGRYLYDYEAQWVALENDGRKLAEIPRNLPDFMLPSDERGLRRPARQAQSQPPPRKPARHTDQASSSAPMESETRDADRKADTPAATNTQTNSVTAASSESQPIVIGLPEQLASLTESQRRRLDAVEARLKGRTALPAVREYMLTGTGAKELPDWACKAVVAEIDRLGKLQAKPLH